MLAIWRGFLQTLARCLCLLRLTELVDIGDVGLCPPLMFTRSDALFICEFVFTDLPLDKMTTNLADDVFNRIFLNGNI